MVRNFNLVILSLVIIVENVRTCDICIHPTHPEDVVEGQDLLVTVWLNPETNSSIFEWIDGGGQLEVNAQVQKGLASLSNASFTLASENINQSILIHAINFGHEILTIRVQPISGIDDFGGRSNLTRELNYQLRFLRNENAMDFIFLIFIALFVLVNNTSMGCLLDLDVIKEVFKRPVGPCVGFFSQFLFMPLASFGMAIALLEEPSLRLGLFALGCSPGGTGSNFWTFLFRGDLNLSVVMTFISTIAAIGMMPLWLYTLGQRFLKEGNMELPYDQFFISLASFILPVGIGIIIKKYRPKWAAIAKKIMRPLTLFFLIFLLTVGFYTNRYIFRLITWQIIFAGIVVAWGGYLFGALAAWTFCMKRKEIIAISIETALQNPGIAFVLLKVSLRQPDADIASVAPASQLVATGIPLWITYTIYVIWRRFNKSDFKEKKQETLDVAVDSEKTLMENKEIILNLKNLVQNANEEDKKEQPMLPECEVPMLKEQDIMNTN